MVFTASQSGSGGPGEHTDASLQGRLHSRTRGEENQEGRTKAAQRNNRTNWNWIHLLPPFVRLTQAAGKKQSPLIRTQERFMLIIKKKGDTGVKGKKKIILYRIKAHRQTAAVTTRAEDNDYFTSGGANGQRSADAVWVCWAAAANRPTEADGGFLILALFWCSFRWVCPLFQRRSWRWERQCLSSTEKERGGQSGRNHSNPKSLRAEACSLPSASPRQGQASWNKGKITQTLFWLVRLDVCGIAQHLSGVAPQPCSGAAGAPEQWKWTFCHRLSLRCHTRVSSDWLERGRPCPSTNCVRRM